MDHTAQDQEEYDVNVEKFLAVAEIKLTFNEIKFISSIFFSLLGYNLWDVQVKPDTERLKPLLELPLLTHSVYSIFTSAIFYSGYVFWNCWKMSG